MLYLIPAPLHRAGLRLAHGVRQRWWRIRAPRLAGCRIIALDAAGQVLLIRHSYGSDSWMPPGGGLARGEDALGAAIRELREETGCLLHGAHLVEAVHEDLHGAGNHVHIVGGLTHGPPAPDGREVIEAGFFAANALPDALAPKLRAALPLWITAVRAVHLRDAAQAPRSPQPRPPAPKA